MLKKPMIIPDDLKYDEKGLIPAVVQDWKTGEVLMVAYMNAESVKKTVETGLTWFWSRSREEYWRKGATSFWWIAPGSAIRRWFSRSVRPTWC